MDLISLVSLVGMGRFLRSSHLPADRSPGGKAVAPGNY